MFTWYFFLWEIYSFIGRVSSASCHFWAWNSIASLFIFSYWWGDFFHWLKTAAITLQLVEIPRTLYGHFLVQRRENLCRIFAASAAYISRSHGRNTVFTSAAPLLGPSGDIWLLPAQFVTALLMKSQHDYAGEWTHHQLQNTIYSSSQQYRIPICKVAFDDALGSSRWLRWLVRLFVIKCEGPLSCCPRNGALDTSSGMREECQCLSKSVTFQPK